MTVLVVGSIGLDTVETPFGKKEDILGGSGIHASVSASFYGPTAVVGVAGSDFPKKHMEFLKSRAFVGGFSEKNNPDIDGCPVKLCGIL